MTDREEALALAREAGMAVSDFTAMDFPGKDFAIGTLSAVIRLIALARQRPGWKWVPEDTND